MNAIDPALAGAELLYGAQRIAAFLGMSPRQVYHLQKQGRLPTFRVGQIVCARPVTLRKWLAAQEAAAGRVA